jgi:hypothetical protein
MGEREQSGDWLKEDTMIAGMKNSPGHRHPQYLIVEDSRHEHLLKREGGEQVYLIRARNREQIYYAILTDMYAPVFETTPDQLLETLLGEPQKHLGSEAERLKERQGTRRLFPAPVQLEGKVEKPDESKGSSTSPTFVRFTISKSTRMALQRVECRNTAVRHVPRGAKAAWLALPMLERRVMRVR